MFGKKKRNDFGGLSPSEVIRREGQIRQQRLKQEISSCAINVMQFENTMDRKLRLAINKAIDAKKNGNATAMRNAYIDIRMALKFLGLAKGMSSAMTRLESNVEFAYIAEQMAKTMEETGRQTAKNTTINMQQLEGLYNRAIAPIGRIAEQMEQFNNLTVAQPLDDYNISDEEVERVIRQAISNPNVPVEPPTVYTQPVFQPAVQAQQADQQPAANSVEAMIRELNDLAKKLQ